MKVSKSLVRFIAIRALMAILLFLTLAAWSMGSAVGSSNDEDFILTSIWCGTSESSGATPYCRPDPDRPGAMIVPGLVAEPELCLNNVIAGDYVSAACQEGVLNEEFSTFRFNRDSYPERFPSVMRIFVGADVEKSVVQMRLFNSLVAAGLILLTLSLNRRPINDSYLTWMTVITPLAVYHIGSVHNSSWTFTGTTCFVFAFTSALKNRKVPKLWVPASVIAIFAFWLTNSSRVEGKYVLIFLATMLLISEFPPKHLKLTKINISVGMATVVLAFFVYQRISFFGRVNIFTDQRILGEREFPHTANDLLINNFLRLPSFFLSFFGSIGLGFPLLNLSPTVWLFSLQATVLLISFAIRKSDKIHRLIFVVAFSMMSFAILYYNQIGLYEINNEISPRYFMPLFIGIVIIAASNKTVRYPNSLVITVAISATISNSLALRDLIRRYVTGQDVYSSKSLNKGLEWWWQFGPQPETVWLTGTLALAGLFAVLIYERNNHQRDNPGLPVSESSM